MTHKTRKTRIGNHMLKGARQGGQPKVVYIPAGTEVYTKMVGYESVTVVVSGKLRGTYRDI